MFLQHKFTNDLIEILNIQDLYDPCIDEVMGQNHCGQEMQDPELFLKSELMFPSGEMLPRCWLDRHYRQMQAMKEEALV